MGQYFEGKLLHRMRSGGVNAWSVLLLTTLLGSGCQTTGPFSVAGPANLSLHKRELVAYVESGRYQRDLARVAEAAQRWIEERAPASAGSGGERLAIVFDLDETLLMNWPEIRSNDFGYIPARWEAWVDEARAPAIEPVRDVYRVARQRDVAVFYITGRTERDRAGTERNLRAIDCAEHTALFCQATDAKSATAEYKTAARAEIVRRGYTIIANLGDQHSDLVGGYAERTFKLPNPFYLTD